jgi:imidazolonepropionase-like amidohydrolase
MKYIYTFIIACLLSLSHYSQQIPAPKQVEAITIVGATAHIGNGTVIEKSLIIFENGKLITVTDASAKIMKRGRIINAEGKHVYPGFIAANSTLGLIEIDAVKATLDHREIGVFNPHIRSIIAYNPESRITETVRSNGVLIAQITPRGGYVSGMSSVVQLDAWNYEDALVKEDDGIHLNWPNSFRQSGWWAQPGPTIENKNYLKQTELINRYFDNAKANNTLSIDLKNEAIKGLFNGSKTLFIHVNGEKEIIDAINFTTKISIKKVSLVGGFDAYKITDLLKKNNVSVILKRIHSVPTTEDQDIKLPFKLAKILNDAGILVALDPSGDMERMQTRNLPFYAGTTVAYGLKYESAVAMLTLNAAKILNIDSHVGSLEVGKDATLFISTGDALDMRTNNVENAFINGRAISLDTHQKQLFRKFSEKYSK